MTKIIKDATQFLEGAARASREADEADDPEKKARLRRRAMTWASNALDLMEKEEKES